MIAGTPQDDAAEAFVKFITLPIWLPFWAVWKGCGKLRKMLAARRAPEAGQQVEILQPVWTPVSDLERTVYAAMILAGRPVTNAELARFMNVSAGEASRRVKQLEGVLRKERIGREVRISLPHLH